MKVPVLRIPYSEEEIEIIKKEIELVLRSGFLTMSERVKEFEYLFAKFCGTKYAIGTNSGTSSMEIVLRSIGIDRSTIIVPSNTYMATPIAVIKAGGRVIFTECQKENMQIDPEDIERKIQSDTLGVVVVHIGGIISPHINKIREICKERNLFLLEDAAHAHGATIDGKMAGSLGIAGSFSFYPTKVLTTAEGGMVTTNDKNIYDKSIILREHGKKDHKFNVHTEIGDNWRFSEIHAVLGIQQMKKAKWIIGERRRIASKYDVFLKEIDEISPLQIPDNLNPAYYKYIAYLDKRYKRSILKEILKNKYQVTLPGEVYSDPCHSQPVFNEYPNFVANNSKDEFPVTDYVCRHHICLPLYPGLTDDEIEYINTSLKGALNEYSSYRR